MMSLQKSNTSHRHKAEAAKSGPLSIALLTVSDSRTSETDINAQFLDEEIRKRGHTVSEYRLIPDDPDRILQTLQEVAQGPAQVVLINGGTGISRRDNTFDVLSRNLEKTLPGFGELFRSLSYEQIGSAAMLSRAVAGLFRGCVVFSTPGSPDAVQLAWEKLIRPELKHLVFEIAK